MAFAASLLIFTLDNTDVVTRYTIVGASFVVIALLGWCAIVTQGPIDLHFVLPQVPALGGIARGIASVFRRRSGHAPEKDKSHSMPLKESGSV